MTASELGVRTGDVGVPQFAMHSIRETAGSRDAEQLYDVLKHFLLKKDLFQSPAATTDTAEENVK